jgi:3-isopropylmalate dehydrogenase
MLLRHSFRLERESRCIEDAVAAVLESGHRTRDLVRAGQATLSTSEMGSKVSQLIPELATKTRQKVAS